MLYFHAYLYLPTAPTFFSLSYTKRQKVRHKHTNFPRNLLGACSNAKATKQGMAKTRVIDVSNFDYIYILI